MIFLFSVVRDMALYFAIIQSWQLSSSEESLIEKKSSSKYTKDFTDLDFFTHIFSLHFLLRKAYAAPEQPTVLFAHRHLNTMLLTIFCSILKI